jgi:hypothetical protein
LSAFKGDLNEMKSIVRKYEGQLHQQELQQKAFQEQQQQQLQQQQSLGVTQPFKQQPPQLSLFPPIESVINSTGLMSIQNDRFSEVKHSFIHSLFLF